MSKAGTLMIQQLKGKGGCTPVMAKKTRLPEKPKQRRLINPSHIVAQLRVIIHGTTSKTNDNSCKYNSIQFIQGKSRGCDFFENRCLATVFKENDINVIRKYLNITNMATVLSCFDIPDLLLNQIHQNRQFGAIERSFKQKRGYLCGHGSAL